MKAILIDDEEAARMVLSEAIQQYCPEVNLVAVGDSAERGFELITIHQPDLVFLDVAMPKESGFDLLRRLPSLNFEIIFVTGFDSYALDAIEFCAIGYLLKPLQTEALVKAVYHAKQRIAAKEEIDRNRQLLQNLSSPGSSNNRIGIPTMDGLEFVAAGDIVRCEGLQRCTKIYIQDQQSIVSSYNLGEFVRLLEPYGFFSTHKSHLINLSQIQRYHKEGTVTLLDGDSVPVSKRKKAEFLQRLTRL